MSTKDYEKGIGGERPGFLDKIIDSKGATDQERGYQDHLKNMDFKDQMTRSRNIGDSYSGDGYPDKLSKKSEFVQFLMLPFCGFEEGVLPGIIWMIIIVFILWPLAILLSLIFIALWLGIMGFAVWIVLKLFGVV